VNPVVGVLLTLRFLLELALLAAWAVVGWHLPDATWQQVVVAAALPIASATLWGVFLSPKAKVHRPLGVRLVMELALFAAASGALWLLDFHIAALVLMGGEVGVLGCLLALHHPPGPDADRSLTRR
jgi:hypothetical protein